MWWYIGGALLLAFLVFWALTWGQVVRTLSSDKHFQEVAASIPALKQAAIANPILTEKDAPQPTDEAPGLLRAVFLGWRRFGATMQAPDDPKCLQTTAGLTVTYAVIRGGAAYDHHIWLRLPAAARWAGVMGRQMDQALITFGSFISQLLGIEKWSLQPRSHPHTHHVVFTLDGEEHEAFATRPVLALSPEWLKTFRRRMMRASW
jgi:hypothetical protein